MVKFVSSSEFLDEIKEGVVFVDFFLLIKMSFLKNIYRYFYFILYRPIFQGT